MVVTLNNHISSLMGPFIGRRGNWAIVKQSDLAKKLQAINGGRQLAHALYFYKDSAYLTIYRIIRLYKNLLSKPHTPIQNQFIKIMLCL